MSIVDKIDKLAKQEWEKIKDHDIFSSFNDFYKLIKKHPEGRCFRKYTNYEWNKENFFFGTYKELENYYKTNTEVPFYLQKFINKKFNQLTINDFECKIENNKRVIYAKCLCECGNSITANFEAIKKNNKRTCGCKNITSKIDLIQSYNNLLEFWDKTKNSLKTKRILLNKNSYYWWKCLQGHSFCKTLNQMILNQDCPECSNSNVAFNLAKLIPNFVNKYWDYDKNILRPDQVSLFDNRVFYYKYKGVEFSSCPLKRYDKKQSTSYPELFIYYYLKKIFKIVNSRHQLRINNMIIECDIFIPSINLAIEYDGSFYHKNRLQKDNLKNELLNKSNIYIIRIREFGLPSLDEFWGSEIILKQNEESKDLLEELNKILIKYVNQYYKEYEKKYTRSFEQEINNRLLKNINQKVIDHLYIKDTCENEDILNFCNIYGFKIFNDDTLFERLNRIISSRPISIYDVLDTDFIKQYIIKSKNIFYFPYYLFDNENEYAFIQERINSISKTDYTNLYYEILHNVRFTIYGYKNNNRYDNKLSNTLLKILRDTLDRIISSLAKYCVHDCKELITDLDYYINT